MGKKILYSILLCVFSHVLHLNIMGENLLLRRTVECKRLLVSTSIVQR